LSESDSKIDGQFRSLEGKIGRLEDKFDVRLHAIEEMLTTIAVQQTEIRQIRGELSAVWGKLNDLTKPDGTISIIKDHQAKCPRFTINSRFEDIEKVHNESIKQVRWIFGGLGTVTAAIGALFIKIVIDLNHLTLEVGKLIK